MLQVNQLQSELRLARSLIAERDSEIQQVRTTNNQARTSVLAQLRITYSYHGCGRSQTFVSIT